MADSNQNIVEFRLTGTLSTSGTTVNVSNDIYRDSAIAITDASITLINEQGTVFELVKGTIAAGVLTTSKRGLTQAQTLTEDSTLKREWRPWTKGFITSFASDEFDKETGQLAVYATTTARDALITAPSNGMSVYVTASGTFTDYIAGAWVNRPTASVSDWVNASETAAWRLEVSTTAQSIAAATDTWETWAYIVVKNTDIAKNIQSATFVYGADAWGDDTYVVALTPVLAAYTLWQNLWAKVTTANTGACSINFWPSVLNIKDRDGADPVTWAVYWIMHFVYDGTNAVIQTPPTLATDAEATTGTIITKSVTPKQAKDNYLMLTDTINFTRAWDAASGAVAYTHSLGKAPKLIMITLVHPTNGSIASQGSYSSLTGLNKCTYVAVNLQSTNAGNICDISDDIINSNSNQATVTATSTTNFTLTWNKAWAGVAGTFYATVSLFA